MKRARFIIILIAAILCTNIALAQEKTALQQVIDSVEQIKYISESDNDGWGGVPISWKLQERLKVLATEDDLARLALESKSPQARAFAYTVLVKRKSNKCFELFKKLKCHYNHIQPDQILNEIRYIKFMMIDANGFITPNFKARV